MAKRSDAPASSPGNENPEYRTLNRFAVIGMGAGLGFVFGTLMWVITGLQGDWHVWLYLAITTAMLGGGVSAAFGAMSVKKTGERVAPRFRRRP
jgi:hypothetical protein